MKALLALLLASAAHAAVDPFGVKQVYPTAPGGKEWYANFGPPARASTWGQDSQDPWLWWKGDAAYSIDGAGHLAITGATPRVYVYDPALQRQWRSVEMTVYAMRVADDNTAYAGIVGVARSNHLAETTNLCDTRGYSARARNDGNLDFAKETSHPNWTAAASKPYFAGGLPKNQWLGYKLAVYDLPNGNVVTELWLDTTDGAAGGTWVLANSRVDDGSNFGAGATACAAGIDPALRLTAEESRPGSESGKPNLAVYFRSTNVGANGLVYKKMSVREIAPAGAAAPSDPAPAPSANPASFTFRGLYAYPNPARRGGATIRLRAGLADSAEVSIYDASGARVRAGNFTGPTMVDDGDGQGPQYAYEYRWDASGAGPGVYTFAATARKAGSPDIKRTGRVAVIK